MHGFLRFLRILTFIGLSFVFVFIFAYDIELAHIWECAINPIEFNDYFYTFNIVCLVAYPILFILSIVYLHVHFGGVKLFFSTRHEVGLLQMFLQNEVQLLPNLVFKMQCAIFESSSNWLGASFIGKNSKGIIRGIRKIIGWIAYWTFPVIMHIILIALFIIVYYILIVIFKH